MAEEKTSSKTLAEAIKQLAKDYGANAVMDMNSSSQLEIERISTGLPSLDSILGGGIPKGRIVEIYGPESSGKTSLALLIAAKCQKETGKKVLYVDLENSLTPDYAEALGVDLKNLLISQPDSGESALTIVEQLAQTGEVGVIVIDSVSNIIPNANLNKEIDGSANIATTARLLSQNLPKINKAAARSGTVVIFINQIRMKIGVMWGNPETTTGGLALKYNASIRLEIRAQKPLEDRDDGVPVKITVRKNKTAPPFRVGEFFMIFGKGFDAESDRFSFALDNKVIQQAGAWFTYGSLKENGLAKLMAAIKADPKIYKDFEKEITLKIKS